MEYFTNITTILQVRTANNTNSYVSFFFFRAVIHVMSNRHSFYKYILVVLAFAVTLEFPRFFEMRIDKVNHDMQYVTTDIMENPYYVQFNSYWNELFVTGFVPLFTLCYMNLKMFFKIKVSTWVLYMKGRCINMLIQPRNCPPWPLLTPFMHASLNYIYKMPVCPFENCSYTQK